MTMRRAVRSNASPAVSYFIGHCPASTNIIISAQKQQRRHVVGQSSPPALFRYELIGPDALCSQSLAGDGMQSPPPPRPGTSRTALATLVDRSLGQDRRGRMGWPAPGQRRDQIHVRPQLNRGGSPGTGQYQMEDVRSVAMVAAGRPPVARRNVHWLQRPAQAGRMRLIRRKPSFCSSLHGRRCFRTSPATDRKSSPSVDRNSSSSSKRNSRHLFSTDKPAALL